MCLCEEGGRGGKTGSVVVRVGGWVGVLERGERLRWAMATLLS